MRRFAYICKRKGLPTEAAQRAALLAFGMTAKELAEASVDDCTRKPAQPERDYLPLGVHPGDEVVVMRLGVVATSVPDAQRFVAALSHHQAVLRDASSGRTYSIRAEAAQDVESAMLLAADIAADTIAARMEKARSHIKAKPGAAPRMTEEDKRRASLFWYDKTLTTAQAAEKAGWPQRLLYTALGPRLRAGDPGKAITKRRTKRER